MGRPTARRKTKGHPFTLDSAIKAVSALTGVPESEFNEAKRSEAVKDSVLVSTRQPAMSRIRVYKDQKALNRHCAADVVTFNSGELAAFLDFESLPDETVIATVAKHCRLSDLRHWIIAEGRHQDLSERAIKSDLKHPVKTLAKYESDDSEAILMVLEHQCKPNLQDIAESLMEIIGGGQQYYSGMDFFSTPEGFIVFADGDGASAPALRDLVSKAHPELVLPET